MVKQAKGIAHNDNSNKKCDGFVLMVGERNKDRNMRKEKRGTGRERERVKSDKEVVL